MRKIISKSVIGRVIACSIIILSLLIGIVFFEKLNYVAAESSDFRYGSGTQANPFLVSNAQELDRVRYHRDAYFKQTSNIDLSDYGEFVSIGSPLFPFSGHYNGDKYYISNLKIETTSNNAGLFSFSNGIIENVRLKDVEIIGEYNVGGIAGTNRGAIIGCIVDGGIIEGIGAVGGIAGLNSHNGVIAECGNKADLLYAANTVDGKYFGGIVGINNGEINNVYNQGSINDNDGNATYIGGIAGLNQTINNTAVIEKAFNIGHVFGKAIGQLVGDNIGEIKLCKWSNIDTVGEIAFNSGKITDSELISIEAFQERKTFNNWNDFNDKWIYLDANYPKLLREYVAVNSIVFEQGQMIEIMPGGKACFSTIISPKHATQTEVAYCIAFGQDIIKLDEEKHEISIKADASVGSTATIRAIIENKTTDLNVKVVKIPVKNVTLRSAGNIKQLKVASEVVLQASVEPQNVSNPNVRYSVNSSYAEIKEGKLCIKENAPIGSNIVVTATSIDDPTISDSISIEIIKTEAEKVKLNSKKEFKVTQSLDLSVEIYPYTTTDKTVHYEIVSTTAKRARIVKNKLYADSIGEVVLYAQVGNARSDEYTIQVKKEPVTDIIFEMEDSFVAGDQLVLKTQVLPKNATYADIIYDFAENTIGADIIDGILYSRRDGKVRIKAAADGITRYKDIAVRKVPVERVIFTCEDSFVCSEKLVLSASILPANATNKEVDFEIIEDSAAAKITDGVLTAEHDGEIIIRAMADDAFTDFVITVLKAVDEKDKIPVQAITFTCGTTFKITEQLVLSAVVYPNNATYRQIGYSILSDGDTEARIMGSVLFADKPGVIKVRADADGVSRNLIINAIKEPVTDVTLISAKSVIVNEKLTLKSVVRPANATYKSVRYEILDNHLGAKIENGDVLTCSKVGDVTVRVYVDDIYRDFTIEIAKLAVTDILFDGKEFIHTNSLELNASVFPENATYPSIESKVISGQDNAWIENGHLYALRPGKAIVRFIADGQSRDFEITIKKQPVEDIKFTVGSELVLNSDYRKGEVNLTADVLPANATYPEITYSVVTTENCVAKIIDDRLYVQINSVLLKDKKAANMQGNVTIKAAADGVYRTTTITLLRNPVTQVDITKQIQTAPNKWTATTGNDFKTSQKMRIEFNMLPFSATYKEFTAEIKSVASVYKEKVIINDDEEYNLTYNNVKFYKDDNAYILEADKPCTIKLSVTPYGGEKTFEFTINAIEEKVALTQLGVELTKAASDPKVATTCRGNIDSSANCPANSIGAYKDYSKIELQQASEISLRAFAHAEDKTLKATYADISYLDLYYRVDGVSRKFVNGENNNYFTYNGNILTIKEKAPVTKIICIYVKSQHGGVESALTEIVIQSKYITEIKNASITDSGLITGLESLAARDETNSNKLVQKVHYKIQHTSGISFEKTFITDNPTMRMQLFNPTLYGEFTIEYTVYFNEGYGEYSYKLPGVNKFEGIKISATSQYAADDWNSVVLFDFSSGIQFSLDKMRRVKSLYVYGGSRLSAKTFNMEFVGDSDNSTDVYLHNVAVHSPSSRDAIRIDKGDIKVTSIGTAYIYGGNGSVENEGADGIFANGSVILDGERLYIKGGKGGTGAIGSLGEKGKDGKNGKSTKGDGDAADGGEGGRGGDGGRGNDGLIGGYAINSSSIKNYCSDLTLIGGDGGKGGQGGRGGDGGNGGKGGDEVSWSYGCCAHGGDGGRGGDGGEGGNGGSGQYATKVSVNNATQVSRGASGAKGFYGDGGNGGYGGDGGKSISNDRGGNAGNGGDGGNGYTAGKGGAPGTPGKQKDGKNGYSGSYGSDGQVLQLTT